MKFNAFTGFDREPAFAGQFYPENSKILLHDLNEYFSTAKTSVKEGEKPLAIISPHAGYVFSGRVAASSFNQIPEGAVYQRVFIIASSHRYSFSGGAIFTRGDYVTPLGKIKVDGKTGQDLIAESEFFIQHDDAHIFEHSLEVQLPFLQQRILPDFQLIPIVLGTHDASDCKAMAEMLEPWFTPDNLFIISTDFSHYPDYDAAVDVDKYTADAIVSKNPEKLLSALKENKMKRIPGLATSLCGWTSVLTLLYIIENKNVEILQVDYQNSGDNKIYGEKHRVVGYQALAVFPKEERFILTEPEKKELLDFARNTVENEIKGRKTQSFTNPSGNLAKTAGAFVSIYCNGELRGCIGSFESSSPLTEVVRRMAVSATRDGRFKSLSPKDLENLSIEISVLTPLKRIYDPSEIEVGKHGIYIKKDYYSGTFLPQVATSRNWSREEFLGRCSRDKAGLGWDGWKTAELFTYEAIIIKEEENSPRN